MNFLKIVLIEAIMVDCRSFSWRGS